MSPFIKSLFVAVGVSLASLSSAQTYPVKPVRLILHNNPGSALDIIGRQVGQRLSEGWKQPVIVDNRAGGGGIVGTDAVAKAAPDGYTLLVAGDGPITILPSLGAPLPYDAKKDLVPVVSLGELDFVLVANPKTGFRTLSDLVDAARRNPGKYNYASSGNGSPQHFAAELLKESAGIYLTHIPYSGGPAGLAGVLANDVDVMFIAIAPALQHIQSGRLVALATGGSGAHPLLPNVPPVADTFKGYHAATWLGLFAPAGTPRAVVDQIGADAARVLAEPGIRSQLAAQGIRPTGYAGDRFRQLLAQEAIMYAGLVKKVGIRAD